MTLILASTSQYRQTLLQRLRLPFQTVRPDVDETPFQNEPPSLLAQRLADAKARAVAAQYPDAWVIGADQVAAYGNTTLGKPGCRTEAIRQLTEMSGNTVHFHTAVCLVQALQVYRAIDDTHVRFRSLNHEEIVRYVDLEQPFDCAGSFKSEGLGISLFDVIQSQDPTALIGLPLIALSRLLRQAGFALP
ncbi:MAG: Maf family nucleotide pyrophosphatase [Xanthomonadaceae bacterium]|jgi:septum formation protein|nr:Maf family nucleotide pyrophosphatase [Xanthomonadaceae bacterium]